MIEFTLRHELDCTVDRHWELFFDHDWTYSLLTEGLGFAGRKEGIAAHAVVLLEAASE